VSWSPFEFKIDPIHSPLYDWIDPTVAIAQIKDVTRPGKPVIVVAPNTCPMQAYEFDPSGKGSLTRLWIKTSLDAVQYYSSPAIEKSGGNIIIGRGHNVTAYELMTGNQVWDYDAGSDVLATPALFAGTTQAYIVSDQHVDCVEYGKLIHRFDLSKPSLASPAITFDKVYVSTPDDLLTFNFDLTLDNGVKKNRELRGNIPGGLSSPAVGKDGLVFCYQVNGFLVAVQ
jgi:outer membrane protein assembly factor BamB